MAIDPTSSMTRVSANSYMSNRVNNNTVAPAPVIKYQRASTTNGVFDPTTVVKVEKDWRVRVSLPGPDTCPLFYNSKDAKDAGIMKPLFNSGGVVFPYTPAITVTNEANYESVQTTHSNYSNFFYKGSQIQAITLTGDFTVQNDDEATYLLAVVYFCRAATKMFFGGGSNAGNPPVMVFLNGYGDHYFPNVPCVMTSFAHTMPADVDYVAVQPFDYNEETTRVPTTSQITLVLQPIYSRAKLYSSYNLESIARGDKLSGFI